MRHGLYGETGVRCLFPFGDDGRLPGPAVFFLLWSEVSRRTHSGLSTSVVIMTVIVIVTTCIFCLPVRLCEELVEAGLVTCMHSRVEMSCRTALPPGTRFASFLFPAEERILLVVNQTTEMEMTRLFKQREEAHGFQQLQVK